MDAGADGAAAWVAVVSSGELDAFSPEAEAAVWVAVVSSWELIKVVDEHGVDLWINANQVPIAIVVGAGALVLGGAWCVARRLFR